MLGIEIAILVVALLTLYLVAWYVHRVITKGSKVEVRCNLFSEPTKTTMGMSSGDTLISTASIPALTPLQVLGQRVRAKRLDLGISQTTLGHAWGIADSTVSNIESGKSPLANNVLMRKAIDDFLAHGLPETAAK